MSQRTYKAYRSVLSSPRWQRLYNAGGRPQRLLVGQHGDQGSQMRPTLYIKALAAPFTVNTIPEATLKALADRGSLSGLLRADGGDCEEVLAQFKAAGVDLQALALKLQTDGAASFVKSWRSLMDVIASKSATLSARGRHRSELIKETSAMRVLVVDVGGTNVKFLATGQKTPRKFPSGRRLTPRQMVAGVKKLVGGLEIRRGRHRLSGPSARRPHRGGTAQPRHAGGSASISRLRSECPSGSSMTPRCRRSAATRAA